MINAGYEAAGEKRGRHAEAIPRSALPSVPSFSSTNPHHPTHTASFSLSSRAMAVPPNTSTSHQTRFSPGPSHQQYHAGPRTSWVSLRPIGTSRRFARQTSSSAPQRAGAAPITSARAPSHCIGSAPDPRNRRGSALPAETSATLHLSLASVRSGPTPPPLEPEAGQQ